MRRKRSKSWIVTDDTGFEYAWTGDNLLTPQEIKEKASAFIVVASVRPARLIPATLFHKLLTERMHGREEA